MNGGEISHNSCGKTGAIHIHHLTMSGGVIKDNINTNETGVAGVWVYKSAKFSGNPVIKDNKDRNNADRNLYLTDDAKGNLSITSALGGSANIGIFLQSNTGVFTNSTNPAFNDASKFVSDNASYAVGKNADGQLILGEPVTVTFNANGHGIAPTTQTIASGGVATQPTAPTETGYTFDGWYTEEGCTNAWNFASDVVSSNATLYAKWTANQYTITFDTDGGSTIESITRAYNSTVTLPAAPTKADSSFAGWNTKADGSGTPYAPGASLTLTGNLTLYAQWTDKAVHTVSGKVTQGGAAVSEVTLQLVQGEKKIAVTETNGEGTFSFSAPDGIYNIIAEKDGKTKTKLVTLDETQTVEIVMPTENVNSSLTVAGNETPSVMVGGLDALAEANGESGSTVTVSMTVEGKSDAENKDDIQTLAMQEHPNQSVECLDISIKKTVGSKSSPITDTGNVLEIVVPYRFKGRENVEVYRYHGSAEKLEKLASKPTDSFTDGKYYPDTANGLLYIYHGTKYYMLRTLYSDKDTTEYPDTANQFNVFIMSYRPDTQKGICTVDELTPERRDGTIYLSMDDVYIGVSDDADLSWNDLMMVVHSLQPVGVGDHSADAPVDENTDSEARTYSTELLDLQSRISEAMVNHELPFVTTAAILENPDRLHVTITTTDENAISLLKSYDATGKMLEIESVTGFAVTE